ncbi:M56 family metallopeptidase [Mucilaginibacter sp.]|uniref:M56 family metallopeptidase n=1 Tax=Mucilaginibacter sp. TaxID=1882438 RepID=UPI000CB07B43|nr:M56 family metallopeptidase [Mucilaginibacter sp.]PLW91035.1 MAG: hypothetical protein C0154_03295 [Mucilaginibacter sp.]HEK20703.1 M56 family peptidase [Bacteroidota bacterium]
MPALFIFLLKANAALLLFCGGYYLILRQLTFYTLNRAYLITGILFATIYPYVDLSSFAIRHEALAKPVQTVIYKWQLPAQELFSRPNYWQWLIVIFWAGVVFLGIRFLMQLFSLYILYHNSKPQRIHNHNVRVIKGDAAPFSFWRSIYINPDKHSRGDLEAILQHEQEHVNGWHTIDIILAELSCIFYWFNPGIWLMKKAVRENIEFITDRLILNNGMDSKSYQYSLINVGFNNHTPGIVNHFNLSTIKKRIIMMNAKRSSRAMLTRYAFVIPTVIGSLLVFTISKADVAKPFTIKLANAIKPVSIALKQAAKNTIAFTDTVPAKATYSIKVDNTSKSAKVLSIKKGSPAKQAFFISTDKKHSLDSANIVVDGKKISKSELAKINPATIAHLSVVTGDAAKAYNDKYAFGNNEAVIVIDTKDSEAGKDIAKNVDNQKVVDRIVFDSANDHSKNDKIILTNDLRGKISDVVITRNNGGATSTSSSFSTGSGAVGVSSTNYTVQPDSAIVVQGHKTKGKTIYIKGAEPSKFGLQGEITVKGYPTAIAIRSDNADNISDKVIVIDGKVASEKDMKKLSAYDINSINIARGTSEDSIKYGDKAKKGIVYITTKKGKNK